MEPTYWHRQQPGKALYDNLLWSRPENKLFAGKLAIIGGNAQGFAIPAQSYAAAAKAGIGTARVLLPDALRKTVLKLFPEAEFTTSTPSGSFSKKALADCLHMALWSDGLLLAGDLGRNSETAVLLEQLSTKYSGQLTITKDAVDYFTGSPLPLLEREATLLVLSFGQLQKLAVSLHFPQAFTTGMDLLRSIDCLHSFTGLYPFHVITRHHNTLIVASGGQVSTTKDDRDHPIWRTETAAKAAVWWLQNPSRPFEALTTSIVA